MAELYYLTRNDLLTLLTPVSREIVVSPSPKRPFLTWAGLIGASFLIATLNLPVIWNMIRNSGPLPSMAPVFAASTASLGSAPVQDKPEMPTETTPQVAVDRLTIGDLKIDAPITWQSDYDSKSILTNLRKGVVHLKGTALPGEAGLTVITGHSSYYLWAAGEYKSVFAPLLSAKLGQEITITRAGTTYHYKIKEIYEVSPDRTDLLVSGKTTLLRLITCTPLGSNTRRLIVDAVQTDPDAAQNQPFTGARLKQSTLLEAR